MPEGLPELQGQPVQRGAIMSQIDQVAGNTPVQQVTSNPIQKQVPPDAPTQVAATDTLDLSGVSHLMTALQTNNIRTDKVAEIRQQLDAGTYDPDGSKLDATVDKLLDELNG
jgi:anti-sigma28 factor (negative regulator of flagellin synthesis)